MSEITNPINVRNLINAYSEFDQEEFGDGRKGVVLGKLNSALKQFVMKIDKEINEEKIKNIADENRRLVLGFIFGDDDNEFSEMSSKELSFPQWRALERWIFGRKPATNRDGHWIPRPNFQPEAYWILNVARAIDSMTEKARDIGGAYPFGQLIKAIEAYTEQSIPFSPGDYGDEESSDLVAASLALPGALPVKQTMFPNRGDPISDPFAKSAPSLSPVSTQFVIDDDDEFVI